MRLAERRGYSDGRRRVGYERERPLGVSAYALAGEAEDSAPSRDALEFYFASNRVRFSAYLGCRYVSGRAWEAALEAYDRGYRRAVAEYLEAQSTNNEAKGE